MTSAVDMRRLLAPLALTLATLLVAAAPAASAARPVCAGPSLVKGAKARLVFKSGSLFGCVRGFRRAVRISDADDYSYWQKPRIAGTFAAVELVLRDKCEYVDIEVTNLRTGVSRTFWAGSSSHVSSAHGCDGYGSPTTDMVLRSDGAIAFIAGGTEVVRGGGSMQEGRHSIVMTGRLTCPLAPAPAVIGLRGAVRAADRGDRRRAAADVSPRARPDIEELV